MTNLFGFDVHMDTLITLWLAMGLILLFAILSVSKIGIVPTKIQAIFEKIISIFVGMTKDMGKNQGSSALVLMCLFLVIIVSNLLGQLPFKLFHLEQGELASPTNDINTTVALAVFVVLYYIYKGVKAKGLSYFKHYLQPVLFMAPFNIMEDFIRPLTLSVRLFANILAGEILIMVLASIVAISLPIDTILQSSSSMLDYNIKLFIGSLIPLPMMFFELFVAFIQALVFTLLTNAYIQSAVGENH
jgi:F-type H+-transporting ATPase subunit a